MYTFFITGHKDSQKVSIFGDVKKFVRIVIAALAAVLLAGCSGSRQQLTLTGGGLESFRIGSPISAVLRLEVNNTSYKINVSDITGKVLNDGEPLLDLKAEDFSIPARSESTVLVPVEASLEPGVGLLSLGRLLSARDLDESITVSVTFTATGFLGFKKTQTIENVPLSTLAGLL